MTLKALFGKLIRRSTTPADEFKSSIEWLEHQNPELAQKVKEYAKSQAIIDSAAGQDEFAAGQFRKIILSRAFFALCLRQVDTAQTFYEMIEAVDYVGPESDKPISVMLRRAFDLIDLLSKHAGRQLPPLSMTEQVIFMCDQLRNVNRSAFSSYLIINRKPVDLGVECDLICSEGGCDSIDTAVLSKEAVDRLDQHESTWRCAKHQA